MKAIIITTIPSPYRVPLFNALHHTLSQQNNSLYVVFLSRTYPRRKWIVNEKTFHFQYEFIKQNGHGTDEAHQSFGLGLWPRLRQIKPDIIIVGGFSLSSIWAFLYAKMYNVFYVVWSGETTIQAKKRRDLLGIRKTIRHFLAKKADMGITYGTESKHYLCSLGIPEDRVSVAINTVDISTYSNAFHIRSNNKKIRILYVGHLTELKGIQFLLRAIQSRNLDLNKFEVHLVGDGTYRKNLEEHCKKYQLNNVFFHGFLQQDQVIAFYQNSDFFVFPSLYDVWGLVCIEAMCAGLPILSSIYAGVTQDLIVEGYNGFSIDPHDTAKFSYYIHKLIYNDVLRNSMGKWATADVQNRFSIEASVNGFINTLRKLNSVNE